MHVDQLITAISRGDSVGQFIKTEILQQLLSNIMIRGSHTMKLIDFG